MTNRRLIQVVRWLSAGTLLLAALYFANLTAYHTWAAGGPPTRNPAWHAAWAAWFFWTTLAFLAAASGVVWLLRKRKPAATKSEAMSVFERRVVAAFIAFVVACVVYLLWVLLTWDGTVIVEF